MSEEEKKALKDCDIIFMCLEDMMREESANDNRKSYKIIRNLIETQQKEIEELKEKNEKIEAINYSVNKNLLETTEEIEELKAQRLKEINNTKYWVHKDKIKAKIEELEKEQEDNRKTLYNAINNLYFKEIDKISNRISVNMSVRDILQSLLEEE